MLATCWHHVGPYVGYWEISAKRPFVGDILSCQFGLSFAEKCQHFPRDESTTLQWVSTTQFKREHLYLFSQWIQCTSLSSTYALLQSLWALWNKTAMVAPPQHYGWPLGGRVWSDLARQQNDRFVLRGAFSGLISASWGVDNPRQNWDKWAELNQLAQSKKSSIPQSTVRRLVWRWISRGTERQLHLWRQKIEGSFNIWRVDKAWPIGDWGAHQLHCSITSQSTSAWLGVPRIGQGMEKRLRLVACIFLDFFLVGGFQGTLKLLLGGRFRLLCLVASFNNQLFVGGMWWDCLLFSTRWPI